ncbi:hypothetical protein VE04_07002 [Pseudogymnoascus sp. 24MN13]|nr:hypothetical protein VE04_07002 [Pseudogymnoascus sp. 24MN13]
MRGLSVEDASVAAANFNGTSTGTRCDLIKSTATRPKLPVTNSFKYNDTNNISGPLSSLPLSLKDPSVSSLDRASGYYLDYYNRCICKLFIVYDSDQNPFRNLISLALGNSTLLKAILALAARHNANRHYLLRQQPLLATPPASSTSDKDALLYKCQAIQGLSLALNDAVSRRQDTIAASIFLLVFLDLLESGCDRWNFHLEGAKNLIASIWPSSGLETANELDPGRTVQAIRSFITRQIYLIETLGATFARPRLLSQPISLVQSGTPPQESVQQSFLGCPDHLLHAIQFFSLQRDIIADQAPSDDTAILSHTRHITTMLESVQNFDSYMWASGLLPQLPSPSVQGIDKLCKLSQSFQLGSLIYGRRVLDALTGNVTSQDDLVCALLGVIVALKDDEILFKCILWPIFIAGLESSSANAQQFKDTAMELDYPGVSENCMEALNTTAPNCPSFLIGVSATNPRLDSEQFTALCTPACRTALTNVRQTIALGCNLDTDVVEFDGVI